MTLFENAQWAVTQWGLTSIKPGAPYEYEIAAKRLLETGNQRGLQYDWPTQVAEKTWVDFELFLEAFNQATTLHAGKYKGSVDPTMMAESVQAARVIAQRTRR